MANKHLKSESVPVKVRGNNIDQALRVLKKRMQANGVSKEMKRRQYFVSKPDQARLDKKKNTKRIFNRNVKNLMSKEGLVKEDAIAVEMQRHRPTPSPV
ncbi:MAG: 30S ribosomal protein S21 [Alphaproteobacteria bacterium]|nr:MAG: 30S ribosomal protein S21 [Alphaproteobacteria bacterium]